MTWREDQALTVDDRRARVPASARTLPWLRQKACPLGGGPVEGSILDERAQPVRIGNAQASIAPFDQSRLLKLVQDGDHGRAGEIADGRNVFLTDVHLMLEQRLSSTSAACKPQNNSRKPLLAVPQHQVRDCGDADLQMSGGKLA